jgi:hypothetical protein
VFSGSILLPVEALNQLGQMKTVRTHHAMGREQSMAVFSCRIITAPQGHLVIWGGRRQRALTLSAKQTFNPPRK